MVVELKIINKSYIQNWITGRKFEEQIWLVMGSRGVFDLGPRKISNKKAKKKVALKQLVLTNNVKTYKIMFF